MDRIENVRFDVDGGYGESGNQTKAFLTLEGDFVNTFEKYLGNESAGEVTLEISRIEAEKLVRQISEYL